MALIVVSVVTASDCYSRHRITEQIIGYARLHAALRTFNKLFVDLKTASLPAEPATNDDGGRSPGKRINHDAAGRRRSLDEELR